MTYGSQLRVAGLGSVLGVDYGPLLEIGKDLGVDRSGLIALLPYVEQGMVAGMRVQQEAGGKQNGRQ